MTKEVKFENKFLLGTLKNVTGNSAFPNSGDNRMIINIVGISGDWDDNPFAVGLSKRWEKTKSEYRSWYRGQTNFKLGNVIYTQVQSDTIVAQILCLNEKGKIDFVALTKGLAELSKYGSQNKLNAHINHMGKDMKKIEPLLVENLVKVGVNTYIYTAE